MQNFKEVLHNLQAIFDGMGYKVTSCSKSSFRLEEGSFVNDEFCKQLNEQGFTTDIPWVNLANPSSNFVLRVTKLRKERIMLTTLKSNNDLTFGYVNASDGPSIVYKVVRDQLRIKPAQQLTTELNLDGMPSEILNNIIAYLNEKERESFGLLTRKTHHAAKTLRLPALKRAAIYKGHRKFYKERHPHPTHPPSISNFDIRDIFMKGYS